MSLSDKDIEQLQKDPTVDLIEKDNLVHIAKSNGLSQADVNKIKQNASANGVPEEKQKVLIKKIQNEELLDSMNPKMLALVPKDVFNPNLKGIGRILTLK